MKVLGQYKSMKVREIPAGRVFTTSIYGRNGVSSHVGLKAICREKPGIVFFNAVVFEQAQREIADDMLNPRFYDLELFGDICEYGALDITESLHIEPDIKSVTNCQIVNFKIPNGALVFLDEDIFIATLISQEHSHSSYILYVNIHSGEEKLFTLEEKLRSAFFLKWNIWIHSETSHQKLLYKYHYSEGKPNHNLVT